MGIAALLSCPVGKVATEPTYIQWEELQTPPIGGRSVKESVADFNFTSK